MTLSGVSSPSISIYTDNSFSNGNFAIKLKQTLTTNVTAGSGRFEFWYDLIKIS